jgi:aspartate aminotransferase-like enzyme
MHKRLFIPGPTEVLPEIRQEMARPPVGHRSEEATLLGGRVIEKVQQLLNVPGTV